tara:strand:+ start:3014 stop:3811 length:798 start_codon:yes stop_codon:yes gene_type:complete
LTVFAATLDPRTTLARPDLAEQALEGLVPAAAYRAVTPMRGARPVADIHAGAATGSERIDQLLFGEVFDVLDRKGGRVWGQARRDGTVGWMDADALTAPGALPTRRVTAVTARLPLNALIDDSAVGVDDSAAIGDFETDLVAVAERLIGVPHALGGRSSVETDCSGLVQQALFACGRAGPRRSHDQAELGVAVPRSEAGRGDLVVWLSPTGDHSWTGHSALMLDADRVIHASGALGAVGVEAFEAADARCRADGFSAPVFRRVTL